MALKPVVCQQIQKFPSSGQVTGLPSEDFCRDSLVIRSIFFYETVMYRVENVLGWWVGCGGVPNGMA